jgi:hypothetical protein
MCIISTDVASYFRHFSHTQSMALFGYPKAQLLTAYVQEEQGRILYRVKPATSSYVQRVESRRR